MTARVGSKKTKVGFYGCAVGRGRLVRVAMEPPLPKRMPLNREVEQCPHCGNRHAGVSLTWRWEDQRDAGKVPELIFEPRPDDSRVPITLGGKAGE